jgi:hypothetical protein
MKQSEGNDSKKRSSLLLALVPLGVALAFGPLVLPRAVPPDIVPLPIVDTAALESRTAADRALAERVRAEPLPDDVRALGSAIREFHSLEARDASGSDLQVARSKVDAAMQAALGAGGLDALVKLRASQLEGFVAEVRRFEQTGVESEELAALGGSFVRRMRREGWIRDKTVLFGEAERRVVFKLMWNAFLALDARAELTPAVDEIRVLFGFYLSHPHASDAKREAIAAARRGAIEKKQCDAIDQGERLAIEEWRMDRINKLAAIDSTYPLSYARGVIHYRRGNYTAAAESFRDWLRDHPNGPWSQRAEGHLRAALAMDARDVTR